VLYFVAVLKYTDDGLPANEARITQFVSVQGGDQNVYSIVRERTYLQHGSSLIPLQ
jgi:hypothetical protein